jgi:outer membrane immunogenic protein
VLGVEADIDWSHINGSVSSCSTKTAAGVIDCSTSSGKIDDFGTVRGRLGYAFDNLLLYGTGGFAWANETVTDTETCNGTKCPKTSNVFAINSASSSATPDGWAAGGGLEWRFLPNWTLRVEYSICNSAAYPTRSTSMGRSKGFPLLLHPMSRQTLVSKSCASA